MGGTGRVSPRQRMQNLHITALYSCIFALLEFTECKIISMFCKQQFKRAIELKVKLETVKNHFYDLFTAVHGVIGP
jgi:hypothetical protein